MKRSRGYRVAPFSVNRRMVASSATVGRAHNNIHAFTEVDISAPRRRMREHQARTGQSLSLTAYVVACLAHTVAEHPEFNALRKGGRLFILDEVTISVLVEREIGGQSVPDMLAVHAADTKTYRQMHDQLRAAQRAVAAPLGALSGMAWLLRLIPPFLFTTFVRLAERNVGMARRYGVVGVTSVGMFGPSPMWIVPLSSATVTVGIGSIVERPVCSNGRFEAREHLCLTLSFNHDIIDGAPAARFTKRFAELLMSGDMLCDGETGGDGYTAR
jgi:pyruvate/2-oxoglutarate dehydrogenase complex dihydrolipoamide acyltransferase (E2) component